MRGDAVTRFRAKVDRRSDAECWPWLGTLVRGHGQHSIAGRVRVYAHRFALEIALGRPISEGRLACHTCDNGWCVNPAHLYEGTPQSNVDDMWARNRQRTALGKTRPDVTARHRKAAVASGHTLVDKVDLDWFADMDRYAARRDVASFLSARGVAL